MENRSTCCSSHTHCVNHFLEKKIRQLHYFIMHIYLKVGGIKTTGLKTTELTHTWVIKSAVFYIILITSQDRINVVRHKGT